MRPAPDRRPRMSLLGRGSWGEASRIGDILRTETVGGALLLAAAVVALLWANSPWRAAYHTLGAVTVGPHALHLDLSLAEWSAGGLLAVFFFVAGLELKREFVAGDLRDPRRAMLPVLAAVGGMIGPAVIFVAVNAGVPGALAGWAVPTATDVAFALAVLGVISTHLPAALRTFLLTLAVVDDLLGITIIGVFYTDDLWIVPAVLMLVPLGLFGVLTHLQVRAWWVLLPLAAATWALMHASGVHATIAGVLLGFAVPVRRRADGTGCEMAQRFERRWRPVSAGVAVPVFAFFAAGVTVVGQGPIGARLINSVTLGVVAALVVGKAIGVLGTTWLVQRFTSARLAAQLSWWDVFGLSILAGMGFTVSLLIGELAFGVGTQRDADAKIGILLGSLIAATLAAVVLRIRNVHYSRLRKIEELDLDADGIPDVYQQEDPAT
ncbi:Na+/H+ antiporter NhaA [Dactylosporangium sp. NPDC000521]|uniref:Na+/H+ antiporter NhaA n=1 Tax=Dactylosporangium sp. NPDC000521 TaxID=3363975 RepID=UPI0036BA3BD0